ncbi:MAG TPA: ABC transporter permease [Candidatus Saccharimonadales bacterium]|nr:ABC transporter permease [Candidatus Saccharimonadales bacterium]
MKTPHKFARWLCSRGQRRVVNHEIDEELRFHLESRMAENIAAGMSPEAAARAARKQFGNLQGIREKCREIRGLAWLDQLFQDLGFGLRILLEQPGALAAALAALTLGIGLVTVMFCAINPLVMRGLPLPEPDRLVSTTVPAGAFPEFRREQTTFAGLVSFGDFHANFRVAAKASRREVCFITANFVDVLRAKPLLGRAFLPGEDRAGSAPVAILSYKLWQEEFQGNQNVPGSTVWVDGVARTVVGVMPADFRFPINDDLWIASEVTEELANRETGFVFGRLKPKVSRAAAQAELNTIWTRLQPPRRTDQPALASIRVGAYVDALTGALYGENTVGAGLLGMLLVSLFILFLACANVAMLTLGRALKRGGEFAIRSALGASRRRLVFQLLAENLVLFAAGAFGGTLAGGYLMHWATSRMPSDTTHLRLYPSWWHFEIDGHVLALVAALTFVVNLLAGLWPALQATKRNVNELLKGQTLGSSHLGAAGFQRLLVISQVSASLVILVGAFAVIRQRQMLNDVHLPFDPKAMLSVGVELSSATNAGLFFEQLDRNLNQGQGLEAALTSEGFAFWHGVRTIEIEGQSYPREVDHPAVTARVVTPDYFNVVKVKLLQGRSFGDEDRLGSEPVAVVNATFARRFLPPENPAGLRFKDTTDDRWLTVVGCVPDVLTYGKDRREAVYYLPMSQHPQTGMNVLLRGKAGSPLSWAKVVDAEVTRLQPDQPTSGAATVQQELDGVDGGAMDSLLMGMCGAAALFLAAVGIFGLVTLSVNQRTKEIGIRLALGSSKGGVVMAVLKQTLPQIGAGLVVGLLLAVALVRILVSVLPATITEPWVYIAVVMVLGSVSVTAVLLPAIRDAKVQPMEALRYE